MFQVRRRRGCGAAPPSFRACLFSDLAPSSSRKFRMPVINQSHRMKQTLCISSACLLLALPAAVQAQTPPLRLVPRTNSYDLVLGSMSSTGAVFLYQAPDLQTLADAPSLLLQTNTPLVASNNPVRLPTRRSWPILP